MNGLYIIICSIWAFLDFANAGADSGRNLPDSSTFYPAAFAIMAVSVILLAVLCWTMTFFCTDCYNAEVDSTSHPACQSTGVGMALPSQSRHQDEGLDMYLPSQQPLRQYHPPTSNMPAHNQYSNLPNTNPCNNACPNPSAPNMDRDPHGYQNYQGYNSMHGYNNMPPASYPSFS